MKVFESIYIENLFAIEKGFETLSMKQYFINKFVIRLVDGKFVFHYNLTFFTEKNIYYFIAAPFFDFKRSSKPGVTR